MTVSASTASEFEDYRKEPQGWPAGELVWLPPGKGGLQTHIAAIKGVLDLASAKKAVEHALDRYPERMKS